MIIDVMSLPYRFPPMTYVNTTVFDIDIQDTKHKNKRRTVSIPFGRDMTLSKRLSKYKIVSSLSNGDVVEHLVLSFVPLDLRTLTVNKASGYWDNGTYLQVISVKYFHTHQQFHTALFTRTINDLLHELKGTIQPVMGLQEFIYQRTHAMGMSFNDDCNDLDQLKQFPYLNTITRMATLGANDVIMTVQDVLEAGREAMYEYIDVICDVEMRPATIEGLVGVYDINQCDGDPITSHMVRQERPLYSGALHNWCSPAYSSAPLRSQIDYSTPFPYSRNIIYCLDERLRVPMAEVLDFLFDECSTDVSLTMEQPDKLTVHYSHNRYAQHGTWTTEPYPAWHYNRLTTQLMLVAAHYGAVKVDLIKTWLEEVFLILHCPDGPRYLYFDLCIHQICSHSLVNAYLLNL